MTAAVDAHNGQVMLTLGFDDFQASLVFWLTPAEARKLGRRLTTAGLLAPATHDDDSTDPACTCDLLCNGGRHAQNCTLDADAKRLGVPALRRRRTP